MNGREQVEAMQDLARRKYRPGDLVDVQGFGRAEVIATQGRWVNVRMQRFEAMWVNENLCRRVEIARRPAANRPPTP